MRISKQVLVTFVAGTSLFWAGNPAAAPTAAEQSLVVEMNRVRAAHGLRPLRLDATLERAARAHSYDMVRRQYFAHGAIGPRLASFGVRGPRVGENIAWGVGARARARVIVNSWLASPSHRANLLRPGFRRIGIGRAVGTFAGHGGASVFTADFAGR